MKAGIVATEDVKREALEAARGSVRPLVQDFAISLPGGLVKHAAKGSKKEVGTRRLREPAGYLLFISLSTRLLFLEQRASTPAR